MRKLIVALGLAAAALLPAMAVDDATVLSPGALYGMIEQQGKLGAEHEMRLKNRIGALETRLQAVQQYIQDGLNKDLVSQSDSVKELERKVGGMQKQITILHAKNEALEKKVNDLGKGIASLAAVIQAGKK